MRQGACVRCGCVRQGDAMRERAFSVSFSTYTCSCYLHSCWLRGCWLRGCWLRGCWLREFWLREFWLRGFWLRGCGRQGDAMRERAFSVILSPLDRRTPTILHSRERDGGAKAGTCGNGKGGIEGYSAALTHMFASVCDVHTQGRGARAAAASAGPSTQARWTRNLTHVTFYFNFLNM